jgi:hypothetical protein
VERYLGRAGGYVTSPAIAMDQLEALGEADQQAMTDAARRKVLDERIARREATSDELRRELEYHESRCRFIGRELKRLQR